MLYWLDVYRANLRLAWSGLVQYRFVVLIWALWGFVEPLVSLAVWTAASAARGSAVAGPSGATYGRSDFAAYFLIYMIFGHLTMSWDYFEFAYQVRTGNLSARLLRPLHPIHTDAAQNIGFKLFTTILLVPIWAALIIILRPTMPPDPVQLALALPAVLLAAVLRYVWQYALAALAFWTTRIDAVNQLYFTFSSFLGGSIAPLALLPGWLGAIAKWSPFRGMGSYPVELAMGRVAPGEIALGFALQIAWLAVGIVVFRAVWAAGIRQYSAVGA